MNNMRRAEEENQEKDHLGAESWAIKEKNKEEDNTEDKAQEREREGQRTQGRRGGRTGRESEDTAGGTGGRRAGSVGSIYIQSVEVGGGGGGGGKERKDKKQKTRTSPKVTNASLPTTLSVCHSFIYFLHSFIHSSHPGPPPPLSLHPLSPRAPYVYVLTRWRHVPDEFATNR